MLLLNDAVCFQAQTAISSGQYMVANLRLKSGLYIPTLDTLLNVQQPFIELVSYFGERSRSKRVRYSGKCEWGQLMSTQKKVTMRKLSLTSKECMFH